MGAGARFPKSHRLRKRSELDRVTRQGRRRTSRHFVVLTLSNDLDHPRLGIIASRRIGTAVTRAHTKRRIREWFRKEAPSLCALDFVVIARRGAGRLETSQVAEELVEITRTLYKGSDDAASGGHSQGV